MHGDAGQCTARVLGKDMNLMLLRQLLRHGDGVALSATTAAIEVATQDRQAQAPKTVLTFTVVGYIDIVNRIHQTLTTTQCRIFPAPHRPHFAGKSACR